MVILPTSRLFTYLFLMPSADGTKPSPGSKQAASCLKFKGTLRRQMGQDWNSLTSSTIRKKKKKKTQHTPHNFLKLQKFAVIYF